jgi:hypothetical protein
MSTIARTLVRLINKSEGIDLHLFVYGNENPEDTAELANAFCDLVGQVEADLNPAKPITDEIDWIAKATASMVNHSGKHYGSHHRDGWLVMIRHDRIDPRRIAVAVNDNQAEGDRAKHRIIAN